VRSDKLIGIQFGRAVAAILVVFYHGGRMLPQYLGEIGLARFFRFGNAGVDFFFVLSGFIIYHVHQKDINNPARLERYVFRRLTRIYPIYWAVALLAVIILVAKQDWVDLAPSHVIASFLLVPHSQDPIVGVAWTLSHEMLFYITFGMLILSRSVGMLAVAIWAAFMLLGFIMPGHDVAASFIESPYHIEFAFGVFAAQLSRSYPSRFGPTFVGLGIATFLLVGACFNQLAIDNQFAGRSMYGLSSAAIIYGLAVWEMRGSIHFPGWAAYLGAASYSIYLIHTFLLGWLGKAVFRVTAPGTAPSGFYLAIVIGSVAGGCALYQFVERPLQAAFRRKTVRAPQPA
jgi:peptidoglycan/LPS O-acetylase OafA/YrhL